MVRGNEIKFRIEGVITSHHTILGIIIIKGNYVLERLHYEQKGFLVLKNSSFMYFQRKLIE